MEKSKQIESHIKYLEACRDDLELALPILDKVYKKTICLHDYKLSEGHCRGLASACEFFDVRFVNRLLLKNCGISGNMLAIILEGLLKMEDFKFIGE